MNRCRVELSVLHRRKERPALWRARRSGHTLPLAGGSLCIVPGGRWRDGTGQATDGGWKAGKVGVWRSNGESFQRCGLGPHLEGLARHILKAVEQQDQICAADNLGRQSFAPATLTRPSANHNISVSLWGVTPPSLSVHMVPSGS